MSTPESLRNHLIETLQELHGRLDILADVTMPDWYEFGEPDSKDVLHVGNLLGQCAEALSEVTHAWYNGLTSNAWTR